MTMSRLVPVALAVSLAGCGSFGAIGLSPFGHSDTAASQPDVIAPSPTPPVETGSLPPPSGSGQDTMTAGAPPTTDDTYGNDTYPAPNASAQPAPATTSPAPAPATASQPATTGTQTASLSRTDLLGGWTITSQGDSCQLFMTLTSWTGGYRASTRGCNNDSLKSISAWNLEGRQIVLAGEGGAPVAHLMPNGSGRFDGQTDAGGAAVSFYR